MCPAGNHISGESVRPDEIYESKAAADTASSETWAAAAITAFPITFCTLLANLAGQCACETNFGRCFRSSSAV
jgi:hypothetical protein